MCVALRHRYPQHFLRAPQHPWITSRLTDSQQQSHRHPHSPGLTLTLTVWSKHYANVWFRNITINLNNNGPLNHLSWLQSSMTAPTIMIRLIFLVVDSQKSYFQFVLFYTSTPLHVRGKCCTAIVISYFDIYIQNLWWTYTIRCHAHWCFQWCGL